MDTNADSKLREGYDRIAAEYATRIGDELSHKPFDRDRLTEFAELVRGGGSVLDLGCGPGHLARHLHELGVEVTGLDVSPGMIEQARLLAPQVPFLVGSMTDLPDGPYAGLLAFYSIIHIPREQQTAMFRHWRSRLTPGGHVLLSFHVGTDDRHVFDMWGHPVEINFLFFQPDEIRARLEDAGFTIANLWERDPYIGHEVETRRCYILARA